jgi:hypothetical protein
MLQVPMGVEASHTLSLPLIFLLEGDQLCKVDFFKEIILLNTTG